MGFTPSVPVYSAERYHRKITSFETFLGLKTTWTQTAESYMKEHYHLAKNAIADGDKPESYAGTIDGLTPTDFHFIKYTANSPYPGYWSGMYNGITTDFMERTFDDGYTALEDEDALKWSVSLKGILDPAYGTDKFFRFVIKNEKCVLSGFKNLDTMESVQLWCLDQEALNIEPNGA